MNPCLFSDDRKYRYSLEHSWDELMPTRRRVLWIGLNPSIADENKLDPTLRRVRDFSDRWGFNSFVMTNLFAFRATDPLKMKFQKDPVGSLNDSVLTDQAGRCLTVIACWGAHGDWLNRAAWVHALMQARGIQLYCLGTNKDGTPRHPLYVAGNTLPKIYPTVAAQPVQPISA